ncbi:hypothetical protein IC235_16085 [Hymenobacter sp. BT664]|uniref:Uncharacterized protein n=1 Tax=Hymenobacter montanus TaxID=2771359 RepID=A0A927BG29_9BACT|nr:hypothetical protein [Hymenobacter montanus]MBD2769409.1 hypothetical protein [Hymenobacter montanus]
MSTTLHEQVMALHRHYNEIARLQQSLPSKRPRHANHAHQEQLVQEKAREVLLAARNLAYAGTAYQAEVENIIEGCRIMQNEPYKKLGGIVDV